MGHTIGQTQGSYPEGESNPEAEAADPNAQPQGAGPDEGAQGGVDAAGMEGTLETSDPDNPQDADDVSAAVQEGIAPEANPASGMPGAGEQTVVIDGEPKVVPQEDVADVVATAHQDPAAAAAQADEAAANAAQEKAQGSEGDSPEAEAQGGQQGGADGDFNPDDHTVPEVNKYLANVDDDERKRVLKAEKKGQARKGILDA